MNKFIIFLLMAIFISCSLVEDAPDATDYANVWDPSSDFYTPPKTLITQKPHSLIKQHTTTFTWSSTRTGTPNGTGIDTSEYVNIAWSFKLNSGEFSNISTSRETTFTFLTDTLNIFEIRTHYPNGEIENPPTTHTFRVDEIDGSSLRFHPRKMTGVRTTAGSITGTIAQRQARSRFPARTSAVRRRQRRGQTASSRRGKHRTMESRLKKAKLPVVMRST